MPKIYKPGKVALVLQGRYAGRKVVVIRQSDEGTKVRYRGARLRARDEDRRWTSLGRKEEGQPLAAGERGCTRDAGRRYTDSDGFLH